MKNFLYGVLIVLSGFVVVSFLIPQWGLKMGEYWKPKFNSY